ncbi:uncharacterized protein J4E84_007389 [Alternaria hordeiaustralica]|uniref:uncharacterized protein n=1 Tax=Alternaria hordeiaustralica TaxID=1187925 RepID=UPI0020C3EF38|nr:uncharacterized protein J4E84_007389 [Alternaria hordeiaustralica]KAI4681793.1 hypothetical protein J4E84_007389 [Alternaria hordeiaustralica]
MHLRKIPYSLVATDTAAIAANTDSSNPSSRSQRFSTAHHLVSEIVPVVPCNPHFTHETPPWTPYGYTLWHPLIASSQNLAEYHEILLPGFLYEDLLRCHSAWVATNKIHKSLLNDVVETLQCTKSGKKLAALLDGKRKWFIRLDQMSPKDSPMGGKLPSSTCEDVITKICSSMRAYGCLTREFEDAKKEEREMEIKLVLNPWDEGMDPAKEFRVFVPPPAAKTGREALAAQFGVSAISQYRWPMGFEAPWGFDLQRTVELVHVGAEKVLGEIVAYAEGELSEEIMGLLLRYGFSYDVALQKDGSVQLVEINPFGALSGCGACLFNWVLDGRVLYGLEEPQFTVTVEEE